MAFIPRSVLEKSKSSVIYLLLFLGLIYLVIGVYQGGVRISELQAETVFLPDLPGAIFLSLMRMLAAYGASLVFAFIFGIAAAKTRLGERLLLPLLDILQSLPVVAFFPAAITFFIGVSNGHRMGVEFAAVFLIFTSQAWNLGFAVYESVKSIPKDAEEAVSSFGLPSSRRFFRLYLPASIPRLVFNSILSWSNGWFFLVACEIIAVGPIQYNLPGIGSFLARAAEEERLDQVGWGLLALAAVVLAIDIFVWRPLMVWSDRFRQEVASSEDEEEEGEGIFRKLPNTIASHFSFLAEPIGKMLKILLAPFQWILREMILPLFWDLPFAVATEISRVVFKPIEPLIVRSERFRGVLAYFALGFLVVFGGFYVWKYFQGTMPPVLREIPKGLFYSTLRLVFALAVSFLWIIPLVYFTWSRPKLHKAFSTLAQMGASLPATALFPLIIVVGVRRMGGGMEMATLILLTFGIQWYVLFNALGGAAVIPGDMVDVAKSFGLTPFGTFRKLVLPSIRPALITGAITAWGGGWNALAFAEYMNLSDQVYKVEGLGALLSYSVYELGDTRSMVLCVMVMVAWILAINLLVWQPLYRKNLERFNFSS